MRGDAAGSSLRTGVRWDPGVPLLFVRPRAPPPYTHRLTSGSSLCFCLSGRVTRTRLESTAVISPLLPVTFYSLPPARPSGLEETDTARRWGAGARV